MGRRPASETKPLPLEDRRPCRAVPAGAGGLCSTR